MAAVEEMEEESLSFIDEQKIEASVARASYSSINMDAAVVQAAGQAQPLRVHFRCRRGLEDLLADEIGEWRQQSHDSPLLELVEVRNCCVVADVLDAKLTLSDLYELRCFDTLSFVLAEGMDRSAAESPLDSAATSFVASAIASEQCEDLMSRLTHGALRYRLSVRSDVVGPLTVSDVAKQSFERNQNVLNDPKRSCWVVDVLPYQPQLCQGIECRADDLHAASGSISKQTKARSSKKRRKVRSMVTVELRPRVRPNPRLKYQTSTFYAGAHPPLAACMARLGRQEVVKKDEGLVVWDPFCGTGMELIETSLLCGNVRALVGTDIDESATSIAEANIDAARSDNAVTDSTTTTFLNVDFREGGKACPELLGRGKVDLIISNPPLGQRVKVANLHALYADLFKVASNALRPGTGRLVFINPLRKEPAAEDESLVLESRRMVDLGLRRPAAVEVWRRV